jgi:DNA-binding MarR family transcriptional regulator
MSKNAWRWTRRRYRARRRLKAGGYIVKDVHPTDHPLVELQLSELGRALVAKIAPLALACENEVLSRLSETEQTVFIADVRKLVAPADSGSKGSNAQRNDRSS